jgi:hypothetical protein
MSGFGNLRELMEAAQRMQAQMARVKDELSARIVSGEAGGGLVSCSANGKGDVLSVTIDPSLLEPGSKRMLEDLVVGAVNQAQERARELAQQQISEVAGGAMPPGFGGP